LPPAESFVTLPHKTGSPLRQLSKTAETAFGLVLNHLSERKTPP